ncbi:MAG: hypothetical protein SFU86_22510 [Pirellulaceae bacterium]|nr:hypothetical protein [Pirellulaceae bacterium]
MSTLLLDTFLPAQLPVVGATAGNRQGDFIAESVDWILAAATPSRRGAERRREARYPYPHPILLTPCDQPLAGEPPVIGVIGRHLSPHGLDFYHRDPLPHRRVIASLDGGQRGWISLLLELTWCRFSRHGWYDGGGRFLAVVPTPDHLASAGRGSSRSA